MSPSQTMLFFLILRALYSNAVLAASLPASIGSLAAGPISSSNVPSPVLLTPSSSNSSSENVIKISCDSRLYGKDLKVNSCRYVFNYLNKDDTQYTFADRDSGLPCDVPLPLRTYSSEKPPWMLLLLRSNSIYLTCKYRRSYSDASTIEDGLCFVQPFLKPGALIGHASPTQIGEAAYTMLQTCVIERGMGGVASNIGGDNNVNVVIADYKPNIKCDSTSTPGPPWNSCVAIFANMKATKKIRIFGLPGVPGVEEVLPIVLEASDSKSQVSIDIDGPATLGCWYELWETVTAIAMMCARGKLKGGKAKGIGATENIRVELSAKEDEPDGNAGNASVVSLADAGIPLSGFDAATQAGSMGFDRVVPFELVPPGLQDEGSVVTLPGSVVAGA